MTEEQKTTAPPRMSFGKFKGHAVAEVPTWYVKWVAKNFRDLDPEMMAATRAELVTRTVEPEPSDPWWLAFRNLGPITTEASPRSSRVGLGAGPRASSRPTAATSRPSGTARRTPKSMPNLMHG